MKASHDHLRPRPAHLVPHGGELRRAAEVEMERIEDV